jgi:hypothetical protein
MAEVIVVILALTVWSCLYRTTRLRDYVPVDVAEKARAASMMALDEWRGRAAECREMIDSGRNPGEQTLLLDLAIQWDKLAFDGGHLIQRIAAEGKSLRPQRLMLLARNWQRLWSEAAILDEKTLHLLRQLRRSMTADGE